MLLPGSAYRTCVVLPDGRRENRRFISQLFWSPVKTPAPTEAADASESCVPPAQFVHPLPVAGILESKQQISQAIRRTIFFIRPCQLYPLSVNSVNSEPLPDTSTLRSIRVLFALDPCIK